jgi:hypothetical protein
MSTSSPSGHPENDDAWGGLADDLPAVPRSVLQPYVEAIARDDPLPKVRPRPDKQPTETEVRLLRRACTTACLLALEVRSDLDPRSLAQFAADGPHDQRRAALVEDIMSAITDPGTDTLDPTRIVRADPAQVINGFVDTIVLVARIVSDQLGTPTDEIVRVCFARADGSLKPPD